METYINERTIPTAPIVSAPIPIAIQHDQRPTLNTTVHTAQIPKSFIERRTDERTTKSPVNSVSSPLTIPIEIQHDQRTIERATTITSPPPFSSIENRFDERIVPTTTAPDISSTPAPPQPTETRIDQSTIAPVTTSSSPPPRPPPPPSFTNNEIIYTEVIKNHERSLPAHHIDLTKAPISQSRSFVIPTKSPSISSKTPSFNYQRPSRPLTTTNLSYHNNKSRAMQSTIAPDRISLYSQRSNKQADVGVTIKNLSECIDRVGIVFDETNRPSNAPPAGLTTVDLIREQLTSSSNSKSTGSLLDKLYKSNSSTRLPTSSPQRLINNAVPRSKSQQPSKTSNEQPPIPK